MAKERRVANRIRKQIFDGILEYSERKSEIAGEFENRRREELRRRNRSNCGTICRDVPDAWLTKMRDFFPVGSAQHDSQNTMLN